MVISPRHYAVELYSGTAKTLLAGIIYGDSLSPVYGWLLIVYEFKADYECDARYVKVVLHHSDDKYGHLWISEIEIYKSDTLNNPNPNPAKIAAPPLPEIPEL